MPSPILRSKVKMEEEKNNLNSISNYEYEETI